jgi:hypothetical protein
MNADLRALITKNRRQARREAVAAKFNQKKNTARAAKVSNGFKEFVSTVSRTAPSRAALQARTNLTPAERNYVTAILKASSRRPAR